MRVRSVLTRQGRDISDLLNEVAGDYADSYTGVLIAESGLNEQALREGKWPDYSAGLSQVIAANLGYGTYTKSPDTTSLALYKAYMFEPANAIKAGWRWYSAALTKHVDPLWAALAYNVGNSRSTTELMELAQQPEYARRLEHYRRAMQAAERYRTMAATVGEGIAAKMAEAEDEPITHEWTEPHANGSIVAKAWGSKGLYIASPDSGGWVAAGPFGGEG